MGSTTRMKGTVRTKIGTFRLNLACPSAAGHRFRPLRPDGLSARPADGPPCTRPPPGAGTRMGLARPSYTARRRGNSSHRREWLGHGMGSGGPRPTGLGPSVRRGATPTGPAGTGPKPGGGSCRGRRPNRRGRSQRSRVLRCDRPNYLRCCRTGARYDCRFQAAASARTYERLKVA